MFRFTQANTQEREKLLAVALHAPPSSPHLLTLEGGSLGNPPWGFAHDLSLGVIGRGEQAFSTAREALQRWKQFDLGWVRIANAVPKIIPGEMVAVEAHTAWLWSINFNRIVEVVDSPHRFGFLYTTTAMHVEEGQERFAVEFDPETESVLYLIEAISRPRHILARAAYPFSRAMQYRFAKESRVRMRRYLNENSG